MNPVITLFHGSPHNIKSELIPSIPRGRDKFQTLNAVFATDIEKVAQLYSLTRDKQRKRKHWFIHKNKLHILKPYTINKKGYVYIFSTRTYISDPINNPNQYALLRKIKPVYKYTVKYNDIKDNIIEYDSKEYWKESSISLLGF